MSPRACRASVDFSRFAAEFGCDLYLSHLLQDGFDSWPNWLQDEFTGLTDWQGLAELKVRLRKMSQAEDDTNIVIASRSGSLMRLASRLISGPCRNVLVTDLTWPSYGQLLDDEKRTAAFRTTLCPIRHQLLHEGLTSDDVVRQLAQCYTENRCDGLFLPFIDNLGVKLPIQRIVAAIEAVAELRFVLVDGAQAFGQIPLELNAGYCDFMIAGCHKWLRAYSPMGVGFFGTRQNGDYIKDSLHRWLESGLIDDPLLRFVAEIESGRGKPYGETVHIAPLFNANAALVDALEPKPERPHDVRSGIRQTEFLHGWSLIAPQTDMRSEASLFQSRNLLTQRKPADALRKQFFQNGVVVTAYDKGLIRVSEPVDVPTDRQWDQLVYGFNGVPIELHDSFR